MPELTITLDDHPTHCVYKSGPNAGQKVMVDGKPVPLIKDQHAIRMNGVMIGYCSKAADGFVSIIDHPIEPAVKEVIVDYVKQKRSDKGEPSVSQTPTVPLESNIEEDDQDE